MKIPKINLKNPDPQIIKEAAEVLESGGIVVHPTDTAYGLAADIFNPQAVSKIFEIKGRDFNKGLIVCVKDIDQAKTLVEFNDQAEKIFAKLLPGALTLLLPKKDIVSNQVSGNSPSLAIRIPNCAVTLALSQICKNPYTTTSANPSGQPNPYSVEDITRQFENTILEKIDLILDAGALPQIPPSTIVDLTSEEFKIIRQGPITASEIFDALA